MEKRAVYDKKGKEIVIKDSLDVQVYPGDRVAYIQSHYSSLGIGVIRKLNPKSINVDGDTRFSHQFVKIPHDNGKV